jgi:lipid-A-disaccharide synthase
MIVAGEASGDLHAAKLVRALREAAHDTELVVFGAAGPRMREEGVEAVVNSDNFSIVGLPEIGRALPMFLNAFKTLKKAAVRRSPDAAILVDFPDFNLKLAKSLKKKGMTVVYYISPQLWAWRSYRARIIRKYVDLMIAILPFEKDWYAARGITHVEYVGSPLAREVHVNIEKAEFCRKHDLDPRKPIISLLPGSRHKEIARILPAMVDAASVIRSESSDAQFIIAIASEKNAGDAEKIISEHRTNVALKIIVGETYDALNASDAAAVTSGTATLEAAIIGTPMVVVYKTSTLNYSLLRPLISVDHFALANLIAEKRIATELIQGDLTKVRLANELIKLIDPKTNRAVRDELKAASEKLGHGGASKRAAEKILKLLSQS